MSRAMGMHADACGVATTAMRATRGIRLPAAIPYERSCRCTQMSLLPQRLPQPPARTDALAARSMYH